MDQEKLYHLLSKKNSNKLNEYVEIWNRIKDCIGKYFDVDVIYKNKYKSAKISLLKMKLELFSMMMDYQEKKPHTKLI